MLNSFGSLAHMTWIEAIVLGIVQGLTEFIPISSTAHLKIVPVLFGWGDPGAAFTAVLQIGTLAAVVSYYWRDILRIANAMLADIGSGKLATTSDSQQGWMIVVGTLPIVVCGLAFGHQIKTTLRSMYVIATAVAGVGVLLGIAEWYIRRREAAGDRGRDVNDIQLQDAVGIGIAQAAALIPGTSRSGATILGGLLCGLTREAAARFSFLLSIPAVFAAGALELFEERKELLKSSDDVAKLAVAVLVAGIVGYATIPWLLGYLRKHTMFVFIVYRLLLAAVLFYLLFSGQIPA
jgi:undecaprenyl-diphosphatase